jgi:hypothetical protein
VTASAASAALPRIASRIGLRWAARAIFLDTQGKPPAPCSSPFAPPTAEERRERLVRERHAAWRH